MKKEIIVLKDERARELTHHLSKASLEMRAFLKIEEFRLAKIGLNRVIKDCANVIPDKNLEKLSKVKTLINDICDDSYLDLKEQAFKKNPDWFVKYVGTK